MSFTAYKCSDKIKFNKKVFVMKKSTFMKFEVFLASKCNECIFWPGRRQSWLSFFVVFLIPHMKMLGLYLKLRHGRLLPHPFQFINPPIIGCCVAWATNSFVEWQIFFSGARPRRNWIKIQCMEDCRSLHDKGLLLSFIHLLISVSGWCLLDYVVWK
jgi:hypothetical protein